MEKKISEKLALWQQRLQQSDNEWKSEVADMDKREKRYNGGRTLSPLVEGDTKRNGQPKKTSHVRNIIFENIESQVSSTIPQPKVSISKSVSRSLMLAMLSRKMRISSERITGRVVRFVWKP